MEFIFDVVAKITQWRLAGEQAPRHFLADAAILNDAAIGHFNLEHATFPVVTGRLEVSTPQRLPLHCNHRMRPNQSIDSKPDSRAKSAAAAANNALISVSFFSITRRELRVL